MGVRGQRVKNPVGGPDVEVLTRTASTQGYRGRMFHFVMNEIGYCAENNKVYIPEYSQNIWEIDGITGASRRFIRPPDR